MSDRMEALIVVEGEESRLLCPRIGSFIPTLASGALIQAGQTIGRLVTMGASTIVVAPACGLLRVQEPARLLPRNLAYRDVLYACVAAGEGSEAGPMAQAQTLADGRPIEAPMEGQFYRSSGPDVPAFVEVGQVIQPGQTIGLIEVMKFFYPMTYSGTQPARVVRFEASDGRPVAAGGIVLWVNDPTDP
jgi:acetyl-CoA carboxylase biotin carboxyl carrier protein